MLWFIRFPILIAMPQIPPGNTYLASVDAASGGHMAMCGQVDTPSWNVLFGQSKEKGLEL